ncbi:hypothetical protein SAMD00019534_031340, partial [Acytostelium subglobosum LB1]|uniref:Putative Rab GTPase-activating protein n=1 Tax=Acytostelium subglobosum TaxID=361139 RepID=G8FUE9_ACYSU
MSMNTNSPIKEQSSFWKFTSSRKSPGVAKPVNNHIPHKFEKFNGNFIPKAKRDIDSSAIFNHSQYIAPGDGIDGSAGLSSSTSSIGVVNGNNNNNSNNSQSSSNSNDNNGINLHKSFSSSSIPLSYGSATSGDATPVDPTKFVYNEKAAKLKRFEKILSENNVDLDALKKVGWRGVPDSRRPMAWKILLGYLPSNGERREETLERKRNEYKDCLPQYYISEDKRTDTDKKTLKQIQMDVPRTNPSVPLFQRPPIQDMLERILYIWGIRHPASGYVQGINDLATPFIYVFLTEFVADVENCNIEALDASILAKVEADSYWCLTKLLDGIQDHYTFAQPGIQRMIAQLKGLLETINSSLCEHLAEQDAQFIQFAFRWMNCLLMREIPFQLIIRMWDTYLSEREGFSVFHVYVCAAFLVLWSDELKRKDFPDIMMFLQKPPTQNWKETDIEDLFSTAHLYRELYHNAQSHLKSSSSSRR